MVVMLSGNRKETNLTTGFFNLFVSGCASNENEEVFY